MAGITTSLTLPSYPDNDLAPSLLGPLWALLGVSMTVVAGRIFVKLRTTRRIYYDDGLMLLALCFGIVHAVTITRACVTGFGRHMDYLTPQEREATLKIGFFSLSWGFLSPLAGRLAFCVTLLFVSGTDPLIKRWPFYGFMTLQILVNITAIIVLNLECRPLDIMWDPSKSSDFDSKCWNPQIQSDFGYFQGSFNTMTDIFLTILPALLIKHSKTSMKEKIGLAFILCLGVLAMIASIVKTYEAKNLSLVIDYTYDLVPYAIWMSIELNIVMIVSSIPILRPLLLRKGSVFAKGRPQTSSGDGWQNIDLSAVPSSSEARVEGRYLPSSSEENILAPHKGNPFGIVRTVEVEVTYSPNDKPHVHAALVGLIQGQIMASR